MRLQLYIFYSVKKKKDFNFLLNLKVTKLNLGLKSKERPMQGKLQKCLTPIIIRVIRIFDFPQHEKEQWLNRR